MGMSIEDLRKKLTNLNNRGRDTNKAIWKPKDKHTVRVLPIAGQEEPWRTVFFHYLNGKAVYCPQTEGAHCDICVAAEGLRGWNDADGNEKSEHRRKADWEIFKQIQAGQKAYFPIVEKVKGEDKKEKIEGPFWWGVSEASLKKIVEICLNEELNELQMGNGGSGGTDILTSVSHGVNLTVDFKKPNNKDNKGNLKSFPLTDIDKGMTIGPISRDKEEVRKLLESIPAFEQAVTRLSSAEVSKIWSEYLATPKDDDKAEGGDVERGPDENNAEKPAEGKEKVEDAVAKLLNG
jgi:hypothetical protein